MDRYSGKPFLRLIECYILALIGKLDPAQRATLEAMEPKLYSVYGAADGWPSVVAREMDFTGSFNDQVRAFWADYSNDARARGEAVDHQAFVVSFVDQNF